MSNSYYIIVAEIVHNEIQLASLIITHSITGADSSEGGYSFITHCTALYVTSFNAAK